MQKIRIDKQTTKKEMQNASLRLSTKGLQNGLILKAFCLFEIFLGIL